MISSLNKYYVFIVIDIRKRSFSPFLDLKIMGSYFLGYPFNIHHQMYPILQNLIFYCLQTLLTCQHWFSFIQMILSVLFWPTELYHQYLTTSCSNQKISIPLRVLHFLFLYCEIYRNLLLYNWIIIQWIWTLLTSSHTSSLISQF